MTKQWQAGHIARRKDNGGKGCLTNNQWVTKLIGKKKQIGEFAGKTWQKIAQSWLSWKNIERLLSCSGPATVATADDDILYVYVQTNKICTI